MHDYHEVDSVAQLPTKSMLVDLGGRYFSDSRWMILPQLRSKHCQGKLQQTFQVRSLFWESLNGLTKSFTKKPGYKFQLKLWTALNNFSSEFSIP